MSTANRRPHRQFAYWSKQFAAARVSLAEEVKEVEVKEVKEVKLQSSSSSSSTSDVPSISPIMVALEAAAMDGSTDRVKKLLATVHNNGNGNNGNNVDKRMCDYRLLCIAVVKQYGNLLYFLLFGDNHSTGDNNDTSDNNDTGGTSGNGNDNSRSGGQMTKDDFQLVVNYCIDYDCVQLLRHMVFHYVTNAANTTNGGTGSSSSINGEVVDILGKAAVDQYHRCQKLQTTNSVDVVKVLLECLNIVGRFQSFQHEYNYWYEMILNCINTSTSTSRDGSTRRGLRKKFKCGGRVRRICRTNRLDEKYIKLEILKEAVERMPGEMYMDPWLISVLLIAGHADLFKIFFERGQMVDDFLYPKRTSPLAGILPVLTTEQSGKLGWVGGGGIPHIPLSSTGVTEFKRVAPFTEFEQIIHVPRYKKIYGLGYKNNNKNNKGQNCRPTARVTTVATPTVQVTADDVERNLALRAKLSELYISFRIYSGFDRLLLPLSMMANGVAMVNSEFHSLCQSSPSSSPPPSPPSSVMMSSIIENGKLNYQLATVDNLFQCLWWSRSGDSERLTDLWLNGFDLSGQVGYSEHVPFLIAAADERISKTWQFLGGCSTHYPHLTPESPSTFTGVKETSTPPPTLPFVVTV